MKLMDYIGKTLYIIIILLSLYMIISGIFIGRLEYTIVGGIIYLIGALIRKEELKERNNENKITKTHK